MNKQARKASRISENMRPTEQENREQASKKYASKQAVNLLASKLECASYYWQEKCRQASKKKCEQTSKKVLLSARDVLVSKQKNCKPASTKAGRVLTRMQVSKQDECRRAGKKCLETSRELG